MPNGSHELIIQGLYQPQPSEGLWLGFLIPVTDLRNIKPNFHNYLAQACEHPCLGEIVAEMSGKMVSFGLNQS